MLFFVVMFIKANIINLKLIDWHPYFFLGFLLYSFALCVYDYDNIINIWLLQNEMYLASYNERPPMLLFLLKMILEFFHHRSHFKIDFFSGFVHVSSILERFIF